MTYTWSVGSKARSHGKGLCHSLHNWCLSKRWTRQVRPMVDAESLFLKIKDHLLYHLYRVFSKILFTNETNEINIQ